MIPSFSDVIIINPRQRRIGIIIMVSISRRFNTRLSPNSDSVNSIGFVIRNCSGVLVLTNRTAVSLGCSTVRSRSSQELTTQVGQLEFRVRAGRSERRSYHGEQFLVVSPVQFLPLAKKPSAWSRGSAVWQDYANGNHWVTIPTVRFNRTVIIQ